MDYQNAEFYRLNKKKGASTLIFNFVDETVTYKKEEGKNGKIRIVEYRKKHNEKSDFDAFDTYISGMMNTDKINILRIVFAGHSDLFKSYKSIKKNIPSNDALILDRVMGNKKADGWVSDYIDNFFCSVLPEGYEKSPRGMMKYFEDEENGKKKVLSEFKYYFSELHSLFVKLYGIMK